VVTQQQDWWHPLATAHLKCAQAGLWLHFALLGFRLAWPRLVYFDSIQLGSAWVGSIRHGLACFRLSELDLLLLGVVLHGSARIFRGSAWFGVFR